MTNTLSGATPVLKLRDVTLRGELRGVSVDALRALNLTIEPGKIMGVVGESGAGKSMLTRLVSGLLPDNFSISSGSIEFLGKPLTDYSARERAALLGRKIAFIPQEPLSALNPLWTIFQTFGEHLARIGVAKGLRRSAARDGLAAMKLPEPEQMLDRYPHQLSGGQCQRVLIAMAFASHPDLLIADEPTTALDVLTQTTVMRLLAERQRTHGTAVLLITHDLRLAAHVCDTISVMYAGELVETGPARDVLGAPRHPYTRALKLATPDLRGERRTLPALRGQMPGLGALASISGCRFADRCPAADGDCVSTRRDREIAPGHRVLCSVACESPADDAAQTLAEAFALPVAVKSAVPVAELRAASLTYTRRLGLAGRKREQFDAVKPLSLTLWPGEFVGIVGESGSGKTSVARLLMGIEQPTEGRVLIGGKDVTLGHTARSSNAREDVQIIFQDPDAALNPRRTVESLLTQALEAAGVDRARLEGRRGRALALRDAVGLPADTIARYPSQLSGGQKQRVNIGRALCAAPRLIVADEIVSGLDVSVQAQILNLLLELRRERQIGLLLISHDLSVVRYLCSRVLVMRSGEVVEEGLTEDVFANPCHPYTRSLLDAVPSDDPSVNWPPEDRAA